MALGDLHNYNERHKVNAQLNQNNGRWTLLQKLNYKS